MSVWESAESLHAYVYQSAHVEVMRQRREWFSRMTEAFMTFWWVPAGHRPSVAEAVERLAQLRSHGPTPEAFTFRQQFPPPGVMNGAEFGSVELPGECPAL